MEYPYIPLPERQPLVWPNGARVALILTFNLETWDLTKDTDKPYYAGGPSILPDILPGNVPDFPNYTWREYGQRVGIWRLFDLFDQLGAKASCTTNAVTFERRSAMTDAVLKRGWELLTHNWEQGELLSNFAGDPAKEREVVLRTLDAFEKYTGRKSKGWLSSSLRGTLQTADILAEYGATFYCDIMNDDQPYLLKTPAAITTQMAALGVVASEKNTDTADSQLGSITMVNKGGSLHLNYALGDHTLTSITAYRETSYVNVTPADLLPNSVNAYLPFNVGKLYSNKFSEEVHIASPTGHFFEYLVGAFYNKLNATQSQVQWGPLGAPVYDANGVGTPVLSANTGANDPVTGKLLGNTVRFTSHNETAAVFGQTKFTVFPQLSVTLGGRYNYDWNGQTIGYFNTDPVPLTGYNPTFIAAATSIAPTADFRTGTRNAGHFTYRIAPQFQVTPDVMVYGTYSTGYKAGGIAYVGNKYDPYNAETVKSWEVGVKSEFLNRRVRLNVDLYTSNYTDFQATILTPVSTGIGGSILASAIGNAPGLRSRGFEGSLTVKPAPAFTLGGAVTYTDAIFTNYVASPTGNYTGTRLTNAPRWSFTLNGDYGTEISSNLKVKAHVDYAYRSPTQTVTGALLGSWTAAARQNADGTSTPNASYSYIPAYGLVNTRVSVGKINDTVEVGVYARNLFNTYFSTGYQIYGTLGLLHYSTPDAYRTVGGYAKFKF